MAGAVRRTFPLATPWTTFDPFLFCVHHHDSYPEGDGSLAPISALDGRQIGMDFEGIDGWNMYHGDRVPGFPQHPHRGFETITFVRSGYVDHADSMGAIARYGAGDVQWLTAGSGIVHSEMFPLVHTDRDNPLELFQIWLNLAPTDKFAEPHFSMMWNEEVPRLHRVDDDGRAITITLVAGPLDGVRPPTPPPNSWAAAPDSGVIVWHLALDGGATWTLPAAPHPDTIRTVYVFDGQSVSIEGERLESGHGAVVRPDTPIALSAPEGAVSCLVLGGRPIGAPVARYGPFVMNSEREIEEAFLDYRSTGFGGWPWPSDDPTHGPRHERFSQHPDGRRLGPQRSESS